MTLDPAFSPLWIVLCLLVAAGAVAFLCWRERRFLSKRVWLRLTLLRAFAWLLLAVLLLNPSFVREYADPEAYYVAVAGDTSASMLTTDLPGREARIEAVERFFAEGGPFEAIRQNQEVRAFRFAASVENAAPTADVMPGKTAIGDSLLELLQAPEDGAPRLGGVLLLSDGISLRGASPVEAARQLRDAGVPVSIIGMGRPGPEGEVSLGFASRELTTVRDEPFQMEVRVENSFRNARTETVEVWRGDEKVASREVTIPGGGAESLTFDMREDSIGHRTYRARFADEERKSAIDHVDYASVEVKPPDTFRVLLLGATPGWQNRFVRLALSEGEQFRLHRIVRVGDDHFVEDSTDPEFTGAETPSFPDKAATLMEYDAILLDTASVQLLNKDVREGLKRFVAEKGGGLLIYGPLAPVENAGLETLVPVRATQEESNPGDQRALVMRAAPVFAEQSSGPLFDAPEPFLPDEELAWLPEELARAARIVAETREAGAAVLAVQQYGGGRSGFLATPATWRWRLASDRGRRQHDQFWQGLVSWLCTGGQPRIEARTEGALVSLEETADVGLDVRGSDFRPRSDAQVRAIVTQPDGETSRMNLSPSLREPGRYEGNLATGKPGEYKVEYLVEFPGGDALTHEAFFTAVPTGEEGRDTRFREGVLRDVARLTGGDYYPAERMDNVRRVPVSPHLPMERDRVYWAHSWLFLLVLLGTLGSEWFLRRREGLR